jgi:hypothetical protein
MFSKQGIVKYEGNSILLAPGVIEAAYIYYTQQRLSQRLNDDKIR